MGHYASEMMCNGCGQCRCKCPPKPDPDLDKWVVDSNYEVMTAKDFDAKHNFRTMMGYRLPDPSVGRMLRMTRSHFDTKEQAQAHAKKQLNENIASSDARTAELVARRKELFGS